MTWHTAEFQGELPVKKEEEKEEIFDLVSNLKLGLG